MNMPKDVGDDVASFLRKAAAVIHAFDCMNDSPNRYTIKQLAHDQLLRLFTELPFYEQNEIFALAFEAHRKAQAKPCTDIYGVQIGSPDYAEKRAAAAKAFDAQRCEVKEQIG